MAISGRFILGEWREGKVRPIPGNAPHGRLVSRCIDSLWSICDDPFRTTRFPQLSKNIPDAQYTFFKGWRNLSVRCGSTKPLGRDRDASRRSAPCPGEERAGRRTPSSSSAMSSGRLFLDRVARQQSPSPLHRQPEHNTHPSGELEKGDVSTLPARGRFYFALTLSR
jgi:hypothetical protein